MARRASKGISIGHILGIGAAILGFVIVGALVIKFALGAFLGGGKTPAGTSSAASGNAPATAPEMRVREYLDSAEGLRGNFYKLSGKVEEMLKWSDSEGRLVSLDVSDSAGDSSPVPVLVSTDFNSINITRGEPMSFIVRVDRNGLLRAERILQE